MRAEAVAARDQFRAQFAVVVDLTVEHQLHAAVGVADRLVAGGEVDDRQPAHAEQRACVAIHAPVVGPAMADDVVHHLADLRVGRRSARRNDVTCDAAHQRVSIRWATPAMAGGA
jgi:hypothetical protein